MMAELSVCVTFPSSGKRHDALRGGKVGKLIRWSGTVTWLEKILLPS